MIPGKDPHPFFYTVAPPFFRGAPQNLGGGFETMLGGV